MSHRALEDGILSRCVQTDVIIVVAGIPISKVSNTETSDQYGQSIVPQPCWKECYSYVEIDQTYCTASLFRYLHL